MDKKSPDVRYICRISGWGFKHLAVKGWFRLLMFVIGVLLVFGAFQSPRGVGVVQTANPRACMVMRQTGIWIFEKHLLCFIFTTPISIV